jgi:cation transporter-like permease
VTVPDLQADDQVAAYRAEIRAVGRTQRLAGFGLVLLGAVLVWGATRAGGLAEVVQMAGYASLAAGWALMLTAIFLRTRYHRRRMAELDEGAR